MAAKAAGEKSIDVTWTKPTETLGVIDHYVIRATAEAEDPKDFNVAKDATQPATVTSLTPFKKYSIQVITVNEKLNNENGGGPGEPTEAVTATTWPAGTLK